MVRSIAMFVFAVLATTACATVKTAEERSDEFLQTDKESLALAVAAARNNCGRETVNVFEFWAGNSSLGITAGKIQKFSDDNADKPSVFILLRLRKLIQAAAREAGEMAEQDHKGIGKPIPSAVDEGEAWSHVLSNDILRSLDEVVEVMIFMDDLLAAVVRATTREELNKAGDRFNMVNRLYLEAMKDARVRWKTSKP